MTLQAVGVGPAEIEAARRRLAGRVRRTPVVEAEPGRRWLKLEHLQYTGSFKPRGAFNRILAARASGALPAVGVVTASGGNAGLGVAYAASALGVPAQVWVPENAPPVKVGKLRALGAQVVLHGHEYAEAYAGATERARSTGALFCHAYDQPEVVAGQATVGLEIAEDVPGLDTVVVAVGGGGLAAGIAASLAGKGIRVVGVEPERAPTLHAALAAGEPVDVEVGGIAADSLGARRIGRIAYAVARRTGVESVLVPEESIVEARAEIWDRYRQMVEPGAAVGFAALACGAYRPDPDERVCVVFCGANVDLATP